MCAGRGEPAGRDPAWSDRELNRDRSTTALWKVFGESLVRVLRAVAVAQPVMQDCCCHSWANPARAWNRPALVRRAMTH